MRNRAVTILIAVFAVMCLSTGTLVADKYCKEVLVYNIELGESLQGPENCNGYDGSVWSSPGFAVKTFLLS